MPIWLSVILEIVKITVPALVVFFTVYYLMKQYTEAQFRLRSLEMRKGHKDTTLPLRLQSYERLSLFCERILIPNLVLRIRQEGMTAKELRLALLFAIQQEYEHNITQQLYVSEQLWQIIKAARDDSVDTISLVYEKMAPQADARDYAQALVNLVAQRDVTGPEKALQAIKKEAGLLLG